MKSIIAEICRQLATLEADTDIASRDEALERMNR